VIANYELLIHDFDILSEHEHDVIICDEATRISNPEAQTTVNLKKLHSRKREALTGTPISNKPDDIWSIIDWLVPRYLGSYYQFRNKYCEMSEDWARGQSFNKISGYKNLDKLSAKVDRFMLRRTKEEVFDDFPPKTIENVMFNLSQTENDLYVSIKEQLYKEIGDLSSLDSRTLSIIPVKMLRLKQCTGHTKLVGATEPESSKLATLKDIIRPILASGEKVIVFTQFAEMLHILAEELRGYLPFTIYGDVDTADRMKRVKDFNDYAGGQIIIMTEAGAYGLNMQSASYVIHYDAPWSIAKLQQREDRAHRIGNNKPVTVYNMIARGTIDEYILKVLARKNKVAANILQDAERLGDHGLSTEDIKDILRL
jgi:SNF2 family DNA or RNA helicase